MPLTHTPPQAVQSTAKDALAVHVTAPLDHVYGVSIAEALVSGSVSLDIVVKMHRFFHNTGKLVERERTYNLRTSQESADVRSWELLGGDAGAAWAKGIYTVSVDEGLVAEDPRDALMDDAPDALYEKFQFGAWRYEYGFTPDSAARFIEQYTKVTGNLIDIPAAFGEAAVAVGNAVYRRTSTPDPLKVALKQMMNESEPAYRVAGLMDVRDMGMESLLAEGMSWLKIKALPPIGAAKVVWAPLVAHLVLAVEKPEALVPINGSSLKPPAPNVESIPPYTQFNDAINAYLTYFHPKGARYHDPSGDPKYAGLTEEMHALLTKAYYGHTITPIQARKVLGKARRWTAENKLAGSLFHLFNAAWAKADWAFILEHIPQDADVYAAFLEFANANPLPKDGVKLQKTISDTAEIKKVKKFLGMKFPGSTPEPASLSDTHSEGMAAKAGTPMGVWSELSFGGETVVHLGFWSVGEENSAGGVHVLRLADGTLISRHEAEMQSDFQNGTVKVLKGHYEKPGTVYGQKATSSDTVSIKPPAPEVVPPVPTPAPVAVPVAAPTAETTPLQDFLNDEYEDKLLEQFVPVDPEMTVLMAKAHIDVPSSEPYTSYLFTRIGANPFSVQLVAAYKVPNVLGDAEDDGDLLLVFQDVADASFLAHFESELLLAISEKKFKIELKSMPAVKPKVKYTPGMWVRVSASVSEKYNWGDIAHWHYITGVSTNGKILAVLPRVLRKSGVTHIAPVDVSEVVEHLPETTPVTGWSGLLGEFDSPGFTFTTTTDSQFAMGEQVLLGSSTCTVLGSILIGDDPKPRLVVYTHAKDSLEVGLRLVYASLLVPTAAKPPEEDPNVPDATAAPKPFLDDTIPWATPNAAKAMLKLGYSIRAYEDLEAFKWRAGTKLGGSEASVVVGMGVHSDGTPRIAVMSANGSIVFVKEAQAAEWDTNSTVVPDLSVIESLKPYGGIGCAADMDYRVPTEVLAHAADKGFQFTKGPKDPAYFPGTMFANYPGVLVGWSGNSAVMWDKANKVLNAVPGSEMSGLVQVSVTPPMIDEEEGIVFARGAAPVALHSDGASFDSQADQTSGDDIAIHPGPEYQPGKMRRAAGTVIVLPPGTIITGAKANFSIAVPSVVLVHPVGGFGSSLTFPKGGADKGEDLRMTARRETLEETGLRVRLCKFLGDYKRSTSLARMFLAEFRGGTPYKAGHETDAVVLRPLKKFDDLVISMTGVQVISDGMMLSYVNTLPWAKVLSLVDRKILADAVRWLLTNGMPSYAPVKIVSGDVAVTMSGSELFGMVNDPSGAIDHYETVAGLQMLSALGTKQNEFAKQYGMYVTQGFPVPGTMVHLKSEGDAVAGLLVGYQDGADGMPVFVLNVNGKLATRHFSKSELAGGAVTVTTVPLTTSKLGNAATVGDLKNRLRSMLWASAYPVPWKPFESQLSTLVETYVGSPKDNQTLEYSPAATTGKLTAMYGEVYHFMGGKDFVFVGQVRMGSQSLMLFVDATTGAAAHIPPHLFGMLQKKPEPGAGGTLSAEHQATLMEAVSWIDPQKKATAKVSASKVRGVLKNLNVPYAQAMSGNKLPFAAWLKLKPHHPMLDVLLEQVALTSVDTNTPATVPVTAMPSSAQSPVAKVVSTPIPKPVVAVSVPTAAVMPWDSAGRISSLMSLTDATVTTTGKKLAGGSKPNKVLTGPDGAEYVFKPSIETGGHMRVGAEVAAYSIIQMLRPDKTPAVRKFTMGGEVGSLQPRVAGATDLGQDGFTKLSDQDVGEVLAQHAVDMFLGDHDGGWANWLRAPDGSLVPIDKGQAFRFMLQGVEDSLDPGTTPAGVVGKAVAKKILSEWAESKRAVTKSAFVRFARSILKVTELTDAQIDAALVIWLEGVGPSGKDSVKKLRAKLIERRDDYIPAWTKVMVSLAKARGEPWKWPIPMAGAPKSTQPEQVPLDKQPPEEALQFTEAEEKFIEDARKANWQGKSLQIDSDAIENQEVMVRSVDYKIDGKIKEGTLISFRVNGDVGKAIAAKFDAIAKVVVGQVGPKPLACDKFFEPLATIAKSINSHIYDKKDVNFNATKVDAYKAMLPALNEMAELTKAGVGKYQKLPAGVVNAMVTGYLDYSKVIDGVLENPTAAVGTKLDFVTQFTWQPPEEAVDDVDVLADLSVTRSNSFTMPTSTTAGNRVLVSDNVSVPSAASGALQYQIMLKSLPGVKLYMSPPGDMNTGARSYFGVVWAMIPEVPSPATVAKILRVFEKATDVRMNPATPEDREYLFLQKQAYITTPTSISVDSATLTQKKPPATVAKARALYEQGDKEAAIKALRPLVAERMGVPVSQMVKDPRYNAKPAYTRGAGRFRTLRMDYTEESLRKLLGDDVYIGHSFGGGTLNLFKRVIPHNGALIANADRPLLGVPISGASPDADLLYGGAVGVFMAMRKLGARYAGHVYFDASLALRTDVYAVGTGDDYGKWHVTRYPDPKDWVARGLNATTGSIGASSHNQFVARHDVDWLEYLRFAVFENKADAQEAKMLCQQYGITSFAGRSLDEVLVTA